MNVSRLYTFFLISLVALITSCAGLGTDIDDFISSTTPTYITASWSGGAAGDPTDRTDDNATDFEGLLCAASTVTLLNQTDEFAGLNIINSCTLTTTYALCVAKGSLTQPSGGLSECATDPFDTDFTDFKFVTLTQGTEGDFINATENLSVVVFYCSDEQSFSAPPFSDQVECLLI